MLHHTHRKGGTNIYKKYMRVTEICIVDNIDVINRHRVKVQVQY